MFGEREVPTLHDVRVALVGRAAGRIRRTDLHVAVVEVVTVLAVLDVEPCGVGVHAFGSESGAEEDGEDESHAEFSFHEPFLLIEFSLS